MPYTRELSIVYGSLTVGGSTARQITEFTRGSDNYETSWIEFEFVTTASTASAFKTELDTVRDAFRVPRQDLVVTQESQTILSLKQSDNTGFDGYPEIVKDGDDADTGRSRHFRVRIEFGRPADNVSTSGRRWSTVKVEYSASRRRTVTIAGTYTALSATASFAGYRAAISSYATGTVLAGIDASASWELIGEPDVTRGETDKVTDFTAVYREIIFNQKSGTLDDSAIVDPQLIITRETEAPGDSDASSVSVTGGIGSGTTQPGANAGPNGTVTALPPGTTTTTTGSSLLVRPTIFNVSYSCSIDYTVTKDLDGKWDGTIRPFIIQQVRDIAGRGVILLEERPSFGDLYENRMSATMKFMSINATVLERKITAKDSLDTGKQLLGVWDSDPYSFYEFQGQKIRMRTIVEERKEQTSIADANRLVDSLFADGSSASGLAGGDNWLLRTRTPSAFSLKTGLSGADRVYIGTISIESVFQFRKKKAPSTANSGGITGSIVSGR